MEGCCEYVSDVDFVVAVHVHVWIIVWVAQFCSIFEGYDEYVPDVNFTVGVDVADEANVD